MYGTKWKIEADFISPLLGKLNEQFTIHIFDVNMTGSYIPMYLSSRNLFF